MRIKQNKEIIKNKKQPYLLGKLFDALVRGSEPKLVKLNTALPKAKTLIVHKVN